ncbi:hypothetical protein CYMTET_8362, partial [Cymbomonas tetramitiformis]
LTFEGTALWTVDGGGDADDHGHGLAVDQTSKDMMLVGVFDSANFTFGEAVIRNYVDDNLDYLSRNDTTWFYSNESQYTLSDAFILRLDVTAAVTWSVHGAGMYNEYAQGADFDKDGNVYVTGHFQSVNFLVNGEVTLRPSAVQDKREYMNLVEGTDNVYQHRNDDDVFVLKLSPEGSLLWAISAGGRKVDEGRALVVDHLYPNSPVYVVGHWNSPNSTFGAMTYLSAGLHDRADTFVMKVSHAGTVQWTSVGGGDENDIARAVTIDKEGDVFVTGSFQETASFGPWVMEAHPAASPAAEYGMDTFVMKLWAADGGVDHVLQLGGEGLDKGYGISATGEVAGPQSLFVAGYFDSVDTFATFGRFRTDLKNTENRINMFVSKMLPTKVPPASTPAHRALLHLPHHHLLSPLPPPPLPPVRASVIVSLAFPTTTVPDGFESNVTERMVVLYSGAVLTQLTARDVSLISNVTNQGSLEVVMEVILASALEAEAYAGAADSRLVQTFAQNQYFDDIGPPTVLRIEQYATVDTEGTNNTALEVRSGEPEEEPSPPESDAADGDDDDEAFVYGIAAAMFLASAFIVTALWYTLLRTSPAATGGEIGNGQAAQRVHPVPDEPEAALVVKEEQADLGLLD